MQSFANVRSVVLEQVMCVFTKMDIGLCVRDAVLVAQFAIFSHGTTANLSLNVRRRKHGTGGDEMLNHIVIMGRLTRDPELRRTQTGTAVSSFTLAVDRDFKDKRATDFIDVVAWRSTGEFVSRYFTKGRMAVVDGRLQIRDWTDKDGNRRRSAEVVADSVYFGDSKREGGSSGQESYSGGYGGYSAPAGGYPAQPGPDSEFSEITTDDGNLPL